MDASRLTLTRLVVLTVQCCLLIMMLCYVSTGVSADEADVVYEGSLRHQRSMAGLQFHIRTSRYLKGDCSAYLVDRPRAEETFSHCEPKEFAEKLAIRYLPSDVENPWRIRWVCAIAPSRPEPWLQQRAFFVLTDKALHTLIRPDIRVVEKKLFESQEDYFQGLSAGARIVSRGHARIDWYYYDLVGGALLANARMDCAYSEPLGDISRQVQGWVVKEKSTFLGRPSIKLAFKSANPNETATVEVLGEPHYTVVNYNCSWKTAKGTFSIQGLKSTKLGHFNGLIYPASGSVLYEVSQFDGEVFANVSDFEVTQVETIPNEVLANWVPELPQGTNLNENNQMKSIPFSNEVRIGKSHSMVKAGRRNSILWGYFVPGSLAVAAILFMVSMFNRRRDHASR